MIRLIAIAGFAIAVAPSAQAMTPAPIAQPDGVIIQVREGCGLGMIRVNGACVARSTLRQERRDDYGNGGYYSNSGYFGNGGLYGGGYYGGAAAYNGGGYYGNSGYGAYASAPHDTSGGDAYILHGNYISEADAVAYCAQRFRSYDPESRTFLAHSGQRVSCPQQ